MGGVWAVNAPRDPFAALCKNMRIHMIGNEEGMKAIDITSRFNPEPRSSNTWRRPLAPVWAAGW